MTRPGHRTCQHSSFSMTCAEFDLLLDRSGNCCEVCGAPADQTARGVLVIDHDHRYGMPAVRGLLCDRCNWALQKVDSGATPASDPIRSYLRRAWFIEVEQVRRRRNPLLNPHADWHRWHAFRRAARGNAVAELRNYLDWYLRSAHAKRPAQCSTSE